MRILHQHPFGSKTWVVLVASAFLVVSCSEPPGFFGVDHNRDDLGDSADADERPSEPVMVGGTFLTCQIVEGEFGNGPAEIGCRVARRDNRQTVNLSAFNVEWAIYDESAEQVNVKSRPGTAASLRSYSLSDDQNWHVYFDYPDNSYQQHILQSSLQDKLRPESKVFLQKSFERFDEDYDLMNADRMISYNLLTSQGYIDAQALSIAGADSGEANRFDWMQLIGAVGSLLTTTSSNPSQICARRVRQQRPQQTQSGSSSEGEGGSPSQTQESSGEAYSLTASNDILNMVGGLSRQANFFADSANPCKGSPSKSMQQGYQPAVVSIVTEPSSYPCYIVEQLQINEARDCAAVWVHDGEPTNLRLHAISLRQEGSYGSDPSEHELRNSIHRFACQMR